MRLLLIREIQLRGAPWININGPNKFRWEMVRKGE